jgi:site-specific DNA recombinase
MNKKEPMPMVRCAIYTRKSTNENLDMDFNTLDAQREACELYIRSQASQGWSVLPDHYDDGGFTGANMERPALQRLIDDIESGKVNCVVVYKVDRLSRSLLDFARLIELFDSKGVSFVSTTQQFNTSQSLGRLVLNILLSFAQFEREMISERTRDKMGAARRKGKWAGGPAILGYRIDRERRRLEIEPKEADQVRAIFELYLRNPSIHVVAKQVDKMGWSKKQFITKDGRDVGGGRWNSNAIHRLLRNPTYCGKVSHKGELFDGEHEAIIDEKIFLKVQQIMRSHACGRGKRRVRNPKYFLAELLYCSCGEPMKPLAGRNRTGAEYRYYVCRSRRINAADHQDHPRIPANEIEPVVIERVRQICADSKLREEIAIRLDQGKSVMAEALGEKRAQVQEKIDSLKRESRKLLQAIQNADGKGLSILNERLGELEIELDAERLRANEIDDQLRGLTETAGRVAMSIELLDSFDELWEALTAEERYDLINLLIARIDVDDVNGKLDLHLHDLAQPFPLLIDAEKPMDIDQPKTMEAAS